MKNFYKILLICIVMGLFLKMFGIVKNDLSNATAKALSALVQKAEDGDQDAQNQLGFIYFEGKAVKKNLAEAEKYFLKSSAQGNKLAQYNLGALYLEYYGDDKTKGCHWVYMSENKEGSDYCDSILDEDEQILARSNMTQQLQ